MYGVSFYYVMLLSVKSFVPIMYMVG